MTNTNSPKTMSYRICRTSDKEQLNGVISLIDFEDGTGIAVVYVSETRESGQEPVWHVSSELIEYSKENDIWFTPKPHIRFNGEKQNWGFAKIKNRKEGPPADISDGGGDNGKNYEHYIKYDFTDAKGMTSMRLFEGNGTGTAGNGETGQ